MAANPKPRISAGRSRSPRQELRKAKSLLSEAGFMTVLRRPFRLTSVLPIGRNRLPFDTRVTGEDRHWGETRQDPGANWRTAALVDKRLAMHKENYGWLNYPDYYFLGHKHGDCSIRRIKIRSRSWSTNLAYGGRRPAIRNQCQKANRIA